MKLRRIVYREHHCQLEGSPSIRHAGSATNKVRSTLLTMRYDEQMVGVAKVLPGPKTATFGSNNSGLLGDRSSIIDVDAETVGITVIIWGRASLGVIMTVYWREVFSFLV